MVVLTWWSLEKRAEPELLELWTWGTPTSVKLTAVTALVAKTTNPTDPSQCQVVSTRSKLFQTALSESTAVWCKKKQLQLVYMSSCYSRTACKSFDYCILKTVTASECCVFNERLCYWLKWVLTLQVAIHGEVHFHIHKSIWCLNSTCCEPTPVNQFLNPCEYSLCLYPVEVQTVERALLIKQLAHRLLIHCTVH